MKIDYQDRTDEYLLHRMSDEESMVFENEVNSNKELQEQLSFTKDVQQVLKSRNEKLAKMKKWQDDYEWEEEHTIIPHISSRRTLCWVSGIAAMFVYGFFLIQNLHMTKDDLFVYPAKTEKDVARGGTDYSIIETLLSQKKYEEALTLIDEEMMALKTDSVELVQNTNIDEEEKEYDMLILKDRQDELKWLKAHAFLGLHRQESALLMLNELRNTEGYYQMSADSLYNLINK